MPLVKIRYALGHGDTNLAQIAKCFQRVAPTRVVAGFDVCAVPAGLFDAAERDEPTAIAAVRLPVGLGRYQSIARADLADADWWTD
jgi:hypothetical protein